MIDEILNQVGCISTPGFFVTVEFMQVSSVLPKGLELFIAEKLAVIHFGATARKFVFREGEWRLFLTFFPTDRVVEKKYGLVNRVMKKRK